MPPDAEPEERSFYLLTGDDAAFVTFHGARRPGASAVVICPPFGWEEISSYRPRRAWAQVLARAGYPTLRLTLPSTGDAGGEVDDPDRIGAWTGAICAAAGWLRRETGAERVVAIGMQLGAMLAYRAAALGGAIDDLVLWSATTRGRPLVRQLRAFSKLEADQFFVNLPPPPPLLDGEVEAAGFRLSAATVAALERLDLAELKLPDAASRRVLLLERDGLPPDSALQEQLIGMGAAVETAPGPGYADMTSHPQFAVTPESVVDRVLAWLAAGGSGAMAVATGAGEAHTDARPRLDGGRSAPWVETPVDVGHPGMTLPAILTEPRTEDRSDLCAVLLDAGAVRRIGPSRMWVQTARRWAQRGVPSLRMDVEGIGDAGGPIVAYPDDSLFHSDALLAQVRAALDLLERRGTGRRFMIVGLCSGAHWAFHACLQDERVCAVAMLNCRVLEWRDDLVPARHLRKLITERPSPARLRRVVSRAMVVELLRWLASAAWRRVRALVRGPERAEEGPENGLLIQRLIASGRRALVLFSEGEPLHDELVRSGDMARLLASPAITVTRVAVNDHTLRPVWAQRRAQEELDAALTRELEITAAAATSR